VESRTNDERRTHVERREVGTVRVKGLIVKVGKLLRDGVDVCHSYAARARGSEVVSRKRDRLIRFRITDDDVIKRLTLRPLLR
jgi:hypothetical protein